MTPARYVLRSLQHHARAHAAVVLGVATAVAALCGALLVGHSVRASLRELALRRLGEITHVVRAPGFARAELTQADRAAAPVIVLEASVSHATTGRRAMPVAVYGVDQRYFSLQRQVALPGFTGRAALLGSALSDELRSSDGEALLLRFEQAEDVPPGSLFGRRELGRTLRVTQAARLAPEQNGELALSPRQGASHTLLVPLELLQRTLQRPGQANAFLLAAPRPGAADEALAALLGAATPFDLGLRTRAVAGKPGELALDSRSALVSEDVASAATRAASEQAGEALPLLVGLANELRIGARRVPYSLVAGLPYSLRAELPGGPALGDGEVVLNTWLQQELQARLGDTLELQYYVWEEQGRLRTARAALRVSGSVPLEGLAADRELAPEYPGITDKPGLSDWDPPFPIDLSLVRPQDERYWQERRATPKAFVTLEVAQRLFGQRLGQLTSLRLRGIAEPARFEAALLRSLAPAAHGLRLEAVRDAALEASQGATDFGEYFLYFSFVLIVGALLLAGLFFRLGVERRLRELGLLSALGLDRARVARLVGGEALLLALVGSLLGVAAAGLYAAGLLAGLRTLWLDAVGTRELRLWLAPAALLAGGLGGLAAAGLALMLTLRGLRRAAPRALLQGAPELARPARTERARVLAWASFVAGLALVLGAAAGRVPATGAFFGAGGLLLAAALQGLWLALAARRRMPLRLRGPAPYLALGVRGACERPGRSLACVALIAAASFLLVSVEAFRREGLPDADERSSGTGGYALVAESLVALQHDPTSVEGRDELGLLDLPAGVALVPFRLQAGDDASCLNLYAPARPRVLGASPAFLSAARFAFSGSLATTEEERANPWLLLERADPEGALPAAVDASSLAYVWHRKLGDVLEIERPGQPPLRLRFVAALRDSLFQSELLVSEASFQKAFPQTAGYRFFLVDAPAPARVAALALLEQRLGDYAFDAAPAAQRWTLYHRVENAYLGTFQALGGLGLLLGTLGLAAVLLRNALERERELALLRALGFTPGRVAALLLAENLALALLGLGCGAACALVAVGPALVERGQLPGGAALAALVGLVPVCALAASAVAAWQVSRWPLLRGLRASGGG